MREFYWPENNCFVQIFFKCMFIKNSLKEKRQDCNSVKKVRRNADHQVRRNSLIGWKKLGVYVFGEKMVCLPLFSRCPWKICFVELIFFILRVVRFPKFDDLIVCIVSMHAASNEEMIVRPHFGKTLCRTSLACWKYIHNASRARARLQRKMQCTETAFWLCQGKWVTSQIQGKNLMQELFFIHFLLSCWHSRIF